eukprot:m.36349 g.36349  ORF g.36349 m.36349 type:complete len:581 (+) comp5395_c0_seq1:154-1896(+)
MSASAPPVSDGGDVMRTSSNGRGGPHPNARAAYNADSCNANPLLCAMLTDFYQITMGYSYWKAGKGDEIATFDLFFRKNPFQGEYTIFAGLDECVRFLQNFQFTREDIEYLKTQLPPYIEDEFFDYLESIDSSEVTLHAVDEGSIVFPKVPLIRLRGPLLIVQLMETPFLTMVNFASLVCTNAARHRIAVGDKIKLLEFGLRRAQGPDGGLSASRYCYMGGFDATSNVLAGQIFGIPVKGTHAHAYVTSFVKEDEARKTLVVPHADGVSPPCKDFLALCRKYAAELCQRCSEWGYAVDPNEGELIAFATYAFSFPDGFLALVDTYDVMKSGIPNYITVLMGLNELGYRAGGVRLDSGDLAYLSISVRKFFERVAAGIDGLAWVAQTPIVASNNINEETLYSLRNQGHEINIFGVGTHLVTCQAQPALGCVFKLVQVNDTPRIKLSEDVEKVTLPGDKAAFRLYGKDGHCIVDLMMNTTEAPPQAGERILCRHPFLESKRAHVVPAKVQRLHHLYFNEGKVVRDLPSLEDLRDRVSTSLRQLRTDHVRPLNPTPYKVSVSQELYMHLHTLWLENAPVGELM